MPDRVLSLEDEKKKKSKSRRVSVLSSLGFTNGFIEANRSLPKLEARSIDTFSLRSNYERKAPGIVPYARPRVFPFGERYQRESNSGGTS